MSECGQHYLTDGKGVNFVAHLNCMSWPFRSTEFCSGVVKLGGTVRQKNTQLFFQVWKATSDFSEG